MGDEVVGSSLPRRWGRECCRVVFLERKDGAPIDGHQSRPPSVVLKLKTQIKLTPDVCHGCEVSLLVEAGETAHSVAVEDSDIPADFSLVSSDASHSEMSMERPIRLLVDRLLCWGR